MKIERFEDIPVWQSARELVKYVYQISSAQKFSTDLRFKGQIQSAACSIMSNIAEGFERNSKKAFVSFLNYAKASAGELRSQAYIALDLGYITPTQFEELYVKVIDLSKQISGFIKYLRSDK